jgi:hypothetical protein
MLISRLRVALLLLAALLVSGAGLGYAYRHRSGAAAIHIDSAREYQQIHGWEANAEFGLDSLHDFPFMDELIDETVDLGITRLRLEVIPSIESRRDLYSEFKSGAVEYKEFRCRRYATDNDDGDPEVLDPAGFRWTRLDQTVELLVLPLARRLQEHGERLWINAQYVAFTNDVCDGLVYDHASAAEYAEFALAVFQHLRDVHGLTPDTWALMLEPDNTRLWDGERLAEAAAHTVERLGRAGFTPGLVAPNTTHAANALSFFEPLWRREGLRPHLRELSYHRYGGASDEVVAEIGRTVTERGIASAMLEEIGASYFALHTDLTLGRVSAWQQFALAQHSEDNGDHLFIVDPHGEAGQRVLLSERGAFLRQYFRALRPGARMLGATTDNPDFEPTAARNRSGGLAVVVKAARAGHVTVSGLEPGTYTTSCWTRRARWGVDSDPCAGATETDASGLLAADVPDAGVLSLVRAADSRDRARLSQSGSRAK